jgi:hypothetical protein
MAASAGHLTECIGRALGAALFKSRFFGLGGGRSEKLFETRRRRGEFFSRPRSGQKIVGFEYSLDFFAYFFDQAKK